MKKKASEYVIEKFEERRRVLFPLAITKGEETTHLDRLIENRNETGLLAFWGNPDNLRGIKSIKFLSEELKKPREVSKDDEELIKNLVIKMNAHKQGFDISGSIGIFYQIENMTISLNNKDLANDIKIPLFFWAYLSLIEAIVNDLSEIFFEVAKDENDNDFIKEFEEALEEGDHIVFGRLKNYAVKWGLTSNEKETLLHRRNLRNEIAHANIWYDKERDKILLRGNEFLELNDFIKEFERIYDFFKQLLFELNNNNEDIEKKVLDLLKYFKREFLKISRSGVNKKRWKSDVVFDWEK